MAGTGCLRHLIAPPGRDTLGHRCSRLGLTAGALTPSPDGPETYTMTSSELLGLHPDIQTRVRAEHFVVRQIVYAALAKRAKISLRDEEDSFRKVADWYEVKARMHDTEVQDLMFSFPAETFATVDNPEGRTAMTFLTLSLVYGNDGPDVVSDWSTRTDTEADRTGLEAWFEPIWQKAVADAGRKYDIEV